MFAVGTVLHLFGSQPKVVTKGQMNSKFYFRSIVRQNKLYSLILACTYIKFCYAIHFNYKRKRENVSFQEGVKGELFRGYFWHQSNHYKF